MNTEEILNQEEIDALLRGVQDGVVETAPRPAGAQNTVRPYDLGGGDQALLGRVPALDAQHERFARILRGSIGELLSGVPEVRVSQIRTENFADLLSSLATPSIINLVKLKPLRGVALVVLDTDLLFGIINCFFGGKGAAPKFTDQRDYTATELRVADRFLQLVLAGLREAWSPVLKLEPELLGRETNPMFLTSHGAADMVATALFELEVDGGKGSLWVSIPHAALEPLRDQLGGAAPGDTQERDENWARTLREEVKAARVRLNCTLGRTEVNLRQLLSLTAGDILPIDVPSQVVADVEGLPVFRCELGVHRGHNALKILTPINPRA
jgi:flagellar motor switch protein FliM